MTWTPIADGVLADRARDALAEITRVLAVAEVPRSQLGWAVVFWAYAAGSSETAQPHYEAALERFYAAVESGPQGLGLYGGGLAGDGFVLAHTQAADDDVLSQIDAALLASLDDVAHHDLIDGLVGIGVYFLERRSSGLARVIDRLRALSPWHTPPERLPPERRATYPQGYRDCGLAHGLAGVIALLSRAGETVTDELRWLDAQRVGASYPKVVTPDGTREPARTAWCYGDPGVAIATWRANANAHLARAVESRDAPEITGVAIATSRVSPAAIDLARAVASRDAPEIVDAGLCHGAIGLAHMHARFFNASGEQIFRDAAVSWLERALALGMTSNRAFREPDFLEGAFGIGLALLAATTPIEPVWDRVMLCDL